MLLRKSFHKSKNFLQKTLQNLKSFLFGGYQRLPKTPPFNPFSCSSRSNPKNHQLDHFYAGFCDQWESDQDDTKRRKNKSVLSLKEPMKEEDACGGNFMMFAAESFVKNKQNEGGKEEKDMGSSHEGREESCSQCANGGGYALAQKMKELEMMDVSDVDHVLDIEEVLHHYSRLTCPVYLDIVDKFFMDMYLEFSLPQASVSINNSSRRLCSVKL